MYKYFNLATIDSTSGTPKGKTYPISTEAIVIVQLASPMSPHCTELQEEYQKKFDQNGKHFYYLIQQAYIDGRKGCGVMINLEHYLDYGNITCMFQGITAMSTLYAYFSGKTISGIGGPSAGIINKIELKHYREYTNGAVDFTIYAGEQRIFFFKY